MLRSLGGTQSCWTLRGKLLAWYQPEKHLGYNHVIRLGWDFIEHKVPLDTSKSSK